MPGSQEAVIQDLEISRQPRRNRATIALPAWHARMSPHAQPKTSAKPGGWRAHLPALPIDPPLQHRVKKCHHYSKQLPLLPGSLCAAVCQMLFQGDPGQADLFSEQVMILSNWPGLHNPSRPESYESPEPALQPPAAWIRLPGDSGQWKVAPTPCLFQVTVLVI